jgi:hypothetical protein
MNAKSVKRALGLAAAAVGTSGAMMLAPAAANAATAHPAHVQTARTASYVLDASYGWGGGYGGYGGFRSYGGFRGYGGYGGYGGFRGYGYRYF